MKNFKITVPYYSISQIHETFTIKAENEQQALNKLRVAIKAGEEYDQGWPVVYQDTEYEELTTPNLRKAQVKEINED